MGSSPELRLTGSMSKQLGLPIKKPPGDFLYNVSCAAAEFLEDLILGVVLKSFREKSPN